MYNQEEEELFELNFIWETQTSEKTRKSQKDKFEDDKMFLFFNCKANNS